MITKDNLKALLGVLCFEQIGNMFVRNFDELEADLKVDFDKQELIYPEAKGLKVENRQTCNFSANENFVVFECVNRLFEKGYKPEHIELEPKWKVGHGASGGRADILVKDNDGKALLIIECKTEGKEFKEAWRKAQNGVSQLLTYAQQQRSTNFLCLYASDFDGSAIKYDNRILTLIDNDKLLEEKKALKPLTYKDAAEVEDLYKVWKETYALDYATKGIFEPDIQPYHIGKLKYTVKDLNEVRSDKEIQSQYHEFATTLRQHNVSGRENAFDKLVNLFLCKIVDETKNANDLKFYWKGIAYDSPFELQDRLQKLYQMGMKEFLGEDVTYIDNNDINKAFRFVKQKPDATKDTILKFFRELKFFTNNDFAFIDVHNEKLFHQNFAVLLKILKMLQDLRLQSDKQNQFLGDMFEGFLDQGVKQSEGQFFTPMPITKFIMMSLPLEKIIRESAQPPKAIDYACGAGHFLNELAMQIKPFVEQYGKGDIREFYKQIYGVEKEYRLSKVAKVSAFMYGQNEINIIYGDALAKLDATKHRVADSIKNGEFDILTANPPYSVKGFLETLSDVEREQFELIKTIEEKSLASNNAIETFFVERAKQLLKPGGVAGIIAPSSILNKGSQKPGARKANNYVATREILLKYFDIVAIVELGSQTFGKTGTNTVILFLRRREENPAPADHYKNRVEAWFSGDETESEYDDRHFIKSYCDHIEIRLEDYETLLDNFPNEQLLNSEIFKEYRKEFDGLTEIKTRQKQTAYKRQTDAERTRELDQRFLKYAREIERDKLYYFVLASQNQQNVVIVKSPADNKAQKQFLGYEWSSAKGNEGIKYFASETVEDIHEGETDEERADEETERIIENQNNLSRINTLLYDPNRRDNPEKLNYYIQQTFNREDFTIPESLAPVLTAARTVDLLDFTRRDFNKTFSLTPKKSITTIETKWSLERLGNVAQIIAGQSPESVNYNESKNGLPFYQGKKDFGTIYLKEPVIWTTQITKESVEGDVLMSVRAPVGDVNKNPFEKICIGRGLAAIRSGDEILQKYLFEFINENKSLFKGSQGTTFEAISTANLSEIKIPLPPKEVQTNIVAECEAIDAEVARAKAIIADAKRTVAETVAEVYGNGFDSIEIDRLSSLVQYGINEAMNENGNGFKIFRMNEIINRKMNDNGKMKRAAITPEEFEKYKLNPGDILFNRTNSLEHVGKTGIFLLEGDYCFASYLIRVVVNRELANPHFVNLMMNSTAFQTEAKSKAAKSINQANINATTMRNIKIPVPPLGEQEKLVSEIEVLETKIAQAQTIVDTAAERKQAVMKKYL